MPHERRIAVGQSGWAWIDLADRLVVLAEEVMRLESLQLRECQARPSA